LIGSQDPHPKTHFYQRKAQRIEKMMTSADMITDFVIRKDSYKTPVGIFAYSEQARQACLKNDLEPYSLTSHSVEMSTVQSLLTAINASCGHLAEEYDFALDFDLVAETGLKAKTGVEPSRIPQDFQHLIAFTVEGGSEGYYVHIGALLPGGRYQEFGIAKTWRSDNAYELAKQVSRFLAAACWN
jgi:hypothetical protein